MRQNILNIPYSEDLLLAIKETKEQFEQTARFFVALKLYELGKISSGKAAQLAGISRIKFLSEIGKYQVSPFQVTVEEILEEAERS